MPVLNRKAENYIKVPADKLFNTIVSGNDEVLKQVFPQAIKSIETLEGSGGSGTVKKVTFEGATQGYVKSKIDGIDKDNLTFTYTTFEGQPWIAGIDKICFEFQVVPSGQGSILKMVKNYHTSAVSNSHHEHIDDIHGKLAGVAKAFEAHHEKN